MQEQTHPLYSTDRDHLDRLLSKESPEDTDIVDLARLLIRYEGFPGANDLKEDMQRVMTLWGKTRKGLNLEARNIWEKGFRPGMTTNDAVGSGFDTSNEDAV